MNLRPLSAPDTGCFAGRFFVCNERTPETNGAFPSATLDDDPEDSEVIFESCSDVPPYGVPDPSECMHPLAYAELPGPSSFFVKVTERRPTAALLRSVSAEVLPWPIEAIPKEDRAGWTEKVRKEAVRRTEPRTKICSGLLDGDRVFLATKSVEDGYIEWLSRWLRMDLVPDPVLWSRSDHSFGPLFLLSVLDEEIERRKKADHEGFSMDEVKLSVGSSTIRGPLKRTWTAMRSLFASDSDSEPVVDSAVLSVRARNGLARLHVDHDGLYKADLPKGKGGLPKDRISRLLRDLDEVSSVARKELRAARGRTVSVVG